MRGADLIAEVLKRENTSFVTGFPENLVFDAAANLGIRPLVARTERVAVNIADGFSRMTAGRRIGVVTVQEGPGAEAAFAAVAQAFGDNSPILVIPGAYDRNMQGVHPNLDIARTYRGITRLTVPINDANAILSSCRRAFSALRRGPRGPVVISPSHDLLHEDIGERSAAYSEIQICRSQADPSDIANIAKALGKARSPIIVAGQGILYAEASQELQELAELLDIPVMTTLNGKSAFPENHRLALGTGGRSRPMMVDHFLAKADFVLALGTSLTISDYVTPIPEGRVIAQVTHDAADIGKCYDVAIAAVGDAKLVIRQLIDTIRPQQALQKQGTAGGRAAELQAVKTAFLSSWMPRLTSDEVPISPYRVVWDLANTVDRSKTVVTHDSGNPRDQMIPFFESAVPHGYMGWGKTTQLGTGFGLMLGAKLAKPDWTAINLMGDAAFGMIAADIESGARLQIPITTIVMNNGVLGGYDKFMPVATERYKANRITGHYRDLAAAFGVYAETVEKPAEIVPALRRCISMNTEGRSALLEILTREEPNFPLGQ